MYSYFIDGADDPIKLIKSNVRQHSFIGFTKNEAGNSTCIIFHHLAQFPARIGKTMAYDGNWYMSAGQPLGGDFITYTLPPSFFSTVAGAQVYTPE